MFYQANRMSIEGLVESSVESDYYIMKTRNMTDIGDGGAGEDSILNPHIGSEFEAWLAEEGRLGYG